VHGAGPSPGAVCLQPLPARPAERAAHVAQRAPRPVATPRGLAQHSAHTPGLHVPRGCARAPRRPRRSATGRRYTEGMRLHFKCLLSRILYYLVK
jgi:hypothetical protein